MRHTTVLSFLLCFLATGCNRNNPRLTQANFDKIQAGMTVAEVEAILGPGEQDGGDLALAEGSGVAGAAGIGGDLQSMGRPRSNQKNYKWGNDKRWIRVTFTDGKMVTNNAKSAGGLN
jgi:hypothetical protein